MNISEKSFRDTLNFQIESCQRSLSEQPSLLIEDYYSICNAYIERLRGIRFAFIDFPRCIESVDFAIDEICAMRNRLADVGRSSVQSAELVGQKSIQCHCDECEERPRSGIDN